jgi:hypothetical protein
MRHAFPTTAALVLVTCGCSGRKPPSAVGTGGMVQVNDTMMYVSSNPIRLGDPVAFSHGITKERLQVLSEDRQVTRSHPRARRPSGSGRCPSSPMSSRFLR